MITFTFLSNDHPEFDPEFFSNVLPKIIQDERKEVADISIIFSNDDYLLTINQQYLNHDYYTDIITFDYSIGNYVSGDLFVSVERVKENSIQYGKEFFNELCRVVFHGVLHLCGYNDKHQEDIFVIRSKEDEYIQRFVSRETK
jgi:rRNA maturation RNase YbeY